MKSTVDTLYILSAGHCGSTLLDLVLGSHSQVVSLGEVSFVPSSLVIGKICSCGQAMPDCGYWQRLLACMGEKYQQDFWKEPRSLNLGFFNGHRNVDFERLTRWFKLKRKAQHGLRAAEMLLGFPVFKPFTGEFRQGIANTFNYYDCARQAAGRPFVVDSSKDYIKGISLYQAHPERARLILLSRDGRGVLHSHLKRDVSREYALSAWGDYYQRALPLLRRVVPSEHVLPVRYEDFAADPGKTVQSICQFAGLTYEPDMLDFANHEHHITEGNDMRMASTSEIRINMAWKKELKAEDLDCFEKRLGAVNRSLGY